MLSDFVNISNHVLESFEFVVESNIPRYEKYHLEILVH